MMFGAYSEQEICGILEARVGRLVVDPRMLQFCAKKVASASGDVRQAFEMTSNAIRIRMKEIDDMDPARVEELDELDDYLVGMKHGGQATREATVNFQKRIEELPLVGKMILCVTAIFAHEKVCETTVGSLKSHVTECLQSSGNDDEILKLEDFVPLLSTLIDQGLIRASTKSNLDEIFDSSRCIGDIGAEPIVLGTQSADIIKALERELKQPFFQRIRQVAANHKSRTNI